MVRRGGLGKGLGALIPADSAAGGIEGLLELPIASIRPNTFQPRSHFDEDALASLAESIREVGVLQPVLVRESADGYELIAGERRWRAARRIGRQTIPAIVRDSDDALALEQALVENIHRAGLNVLEEAAAYQQLIEDFSLTHEEVAARVGRSRSAVSNMLRLFQLPPSVQRLVQEGRIEMGHARALLATPDRTFQESLARRAANEGMSVRAVEAAVRAHLGNVAAGRPAGVKAPKLRAPGLLELEELLGDLLDTRVSVSMGPKKGRVVVEFSTLEDLERIYRAMTDGVVTNEPGDSGASVDAEAG